VRRHIFLTKIIFLMIFFPGLDAKAQDNGWEELFFKANQAFKQGHYQEAIDVYERLVRGGYESGHIYYNLGNGYFRLNRLGQAILNYERARLFMPRDADLNFNLSHASDQILDAVPESQGFSQMAFFWLDSLSLDELFWSFAVLNVLFWVILLTRLFHRSEWNYYLSLVLVVIWLIWGISFGLKWHQVGTDDRAVILEQEVNILAGPDIQDTVLFKLHRGTIVHQERSEDGWFLIRLPDKKRGWVKAEAVERISK
jgi:tetratricopeptide (TPR) repeat protein